MSHEEFTNIYNRCFGLVISHARNLLRVDSSYAEDVAADVFLKLWESQPNITSTEMAVNWCSLCTKHRSIDLLRKNSYRRYFPLYDSDYILDDTTRQIIDGRLLSNEIDSITSSMPPKIGRAFRMYFFHELSRKEISEILRANENTVKNQLHEAKLKLKKPLNQ